MKFSAILCLLIIFACGCNRNNMQTKLLCEQKSLKDSANDIDERVAGYMYEGLYDSAEAKKLQLRAVHGIDLDGLEYIKPFPKIGYTGEWYDYISAVDNAGIGLLNLVPELWNSGVANYQSARRGTYFKDLGRELNAVGKGLKQTGVQLWTQPLETLSSPQSIEFLVSLYIGSKVALPTSTKVSRTLPICKLDVKIIPSI